MTGEIDRETIEVHKISIVPHCAEVGILVTSDHHTLGLSHSLHPDPCAWLSWPLLGNLVTVLTLGAPGTIIFSWRQK